MRFKDLFKTALTAITSNKLQAFLSMLGVIIGIGSVVLIVAISEGAKAQIEEQINSLGTNTVSGNVFNLDDSGIKIKYDDFYGMANSPFIDYVTVEASTFTEVSYSETSIQSRVYGVDSFYFDYKDVPLAAGRYINTGDVIGERRFAVIGSKVANDLFGNSNPIGRFITIVERVNQQGAPGQGGQPQTINHEYQVIGLLEEENESFNGSVNGNIYISITSGERDLGMDIRQFFVIGNSTQTLASAEDDARIYLEGMIYPYIVDELNGEQDDFFGGGGFPEIGRPEISPMPRGEVKQEMSIRPPIFPGGGGAQFERNPVQDYYFLFNSGDFVTEALGMITVVTILIGGVAAISLFVGGIGIANVMFMSVLERTKEIGLRKAIGARNIDITMQFLLESVVITFVGGMIGLALGAVGASIFSALVPDLNALLNFNVMIATFIVSVLTGILSGFFPSRKAAKLNPIDALRHE